MVQTVYALTFVYNVALAAIILVVPLYLRELGVSPMVLGLAASVPPMIQLLLRLPSGVVSDRVGERAVLLVSNAAMAVAAGLLLLAPSFATTGMIVGALVLSGVSRGIYWPSAQSYTSRVARGDTARVLGLFTSIGHFGAIVGTPLAGAFLAWSGVGAGFTLILGGAAAGLLLSARLARPAGRDATAGAATSSGTGSARAKGPGLLASLGGLIRSRPLLFSGLCMSGAGVALALLSSFYPVYLADLGMDENAIGLLSSCRAVTAMVSSFVFGMLGRRLSPPVAWFAGALLCGVGIGMTPFLGSSVGLALGMGIVGVSNGLLQVLSVTIAADASRAENRAIAMAFTGLFYSLTLWAVPLVLGLVAEVSSVETGFAGLGLLWIVLAFALVAPARAMFRRPEPAATAASGD